MSEKNPKPSPSIEEVERKRNEDQKRPVTPDNPGPDSNTPLDPIVDHVPGERRPVPIQHDTPAGQPKP